jgi:hypothetical protein
VHVHVVGGFVVKLLIGLKSYLISTTSLGKVDEIYEFI